MPVSPAPRFTSHGLTHLGLVRRRNEDAFLDRPDGGLWAVADGMGGHEAGDLASRMIVDVLGLLEPASDLDDLVDAATTELTGVDAALRRRAALLGPGAVIASTVVVLLSGVAEVTCLWAGDSRLYRWRAGVLRQLTIDHSKVQEMVDAGLLRPEQMAGHPLSHIVTRSVGGGRLDFGMLREKLRAGDRFLLCSDGLTNMVADSEIARELGQAPPGDATGRLIDLVLARGAIDNVTIVIVHANPAE